mgnify:CR=1 FL=1
MTPTREVPTKFVDAFDLRVTIRAVSERAILQGLSAARTKFNSKQTVNRIRPDRDTLFAQNRCKITGRSVGPKLTRVHQQARCFRFNFLPERRGEFRLAIASNSPAAHVFQIRSAAISSGSWPTSRVPRRMVLDRRQTVLQCTRCRNGGCFSASIAA